MESDKHYFIEGLFVIVFSIAIAFFFVWLARPGNKDDVLYRIHFEESVSGLSLGDSVKYLGVDVGAVESMVIDKDDPNKVQVDIKLHKDTPVKTDTKATLKLKGITGVFFIELTGGGAETPALVAVTPKGQVPEIPAQKSSLNTLLEELPKVVAKFSSIEGKFSAIESNANRVVNDIGEVTAKVKENPSLLLRRPKKKTNGNQ